MQLTATTLSKPSHTAAFPVCLLRWGPSHTKPETQGIEALDSSFVAVGET
jgi:hypothetical protein